LQVLKVFLGQVHVLVLVRVGPTLVNITEPSLAREFVETLFLMPKMKQ